MPDPDTRTVGQLAALAGVTVRTLHHYDEIGLLRPSVRGTGGRRVYTPADAARLSHILGYRALDVPLERIAELLTGATSESEVLQAQLTSIDRRLAELTKLRDHLVITLEANHMDIKLTPEERLEVFGSDDPAQWQSEAEQRWGESDAWRQTHERTRRYSADDWRRIQAESDGIEGDFAAALAAGEPATGPVAIALAERARRHIDATYYSLTHEMHRGLAELYVTDPRFATHFDQRIAGLAQFVHAAINANADAAAASGGQQHGEGGPR